MRRSPTSGGGGGGGGPNGTACLTPSHRLRNLCDWKGSMEISRSKNGNGLKPSSGWYLSLWFPSLLLQLQWISYKKLIHTCFGRRWTSLFTIRAIFLVVGDREGSVPIATSISLRSIGQWTFVLVSIDRHEHVFLLHIQGDSKKCPTFVLLIFHKYFRSHEQQLHHRKPPSMEIGLASSHMIWCAGYDQYGA